MTNEKDFNLTKKQRTLIMIPLLIGGFISLLNETLLNVAFPQLTASLHISTATAQWLATAYMLIIGISVPLVAFLMETFTTKKLYLTAMTMFLLGTIGCGFSQSFFCLLIFRMLQGAGTGMLLPIMMNTVLTIYPPEKRGTAMGTSMIIVIAAPAIGPSLSGAVLGCLSWHWLFFLIIPFAVFAIIIAAINIKNVSTLTKPKIDILSIFLSAIGFGGLIFGISSVESMGFSNIIVIASLVCGIGGLYFFAKRQFSLKQPMLELRTFKFPIFTLGIILTMIAFMIPFSINIILPTYMQNSMKLTPFITGLILMPGSIVSIIFTPLAGRLFDKIGAKLLVTTGFILLAIAMFFFSHITAATTLFMIIALHICVFLGIACISTPIQTNTLNQLPREYHTHGVAVMSTMQQIAAAFGSALFIGLMGAEQTKYLARFKTPDILQQQAAIIYGVNRAFTAALLLVVIALILSFFIKRKVTTKNTLSQKTTPVHAHES